MLPGFVDSHCHLVFAGDRAQEFAARMAGKPYAAGGIRTTVAATRAATDEQLTAHVARLVAGDAPAGHHHRRDQERLRPDRPRRGPQPGGRAAVHRRDHVPRRARRARRSTPGPGRLRRRWSPGRCSRPRRRTPAGSTCSASAAPSTSTRPAPCWPPARRRASRGRLHANQLGPGPGVRLAAELGLAAVDHCTYLTDADVDALRDSGTIATLLPGVEFSTRQPYPDARRLLDAGVRGGARQRLQPRLVLHQLDAALHRPGGPRDGDDPGRGAYAATYGGARALLDRDDVGRLTVGARADLVLLDAPSATCTWPTGPACRWWPAPGVAGAPS